jgi:hypothetical protein
MKIRQVAILALTAVLMPVSAEALPSFARREGVGCTMCHSTIPRLNRKGYEYQNAGYRMPAKIGVASDPEFGEMNSALTASGVSWLRTVDPGGVATTQSDINVISATLFPATGSFGRYWSSRIELSLSPGEAPEIEGAFVRGTFGNAEQHLNVRIGVMHPWEGYGAADEPVGLSSPLFQMTAPADRVSGTATFFAPMNFNQAGIEVGYTFASFNIAAKVSNGIVVAPDASGADANIGGGLSRSASDPNRNAKDFQVFANQFIGDEAAVSAFYYHGTSSIPVPAVTPATTWTDTFDRAALYATVPILPRKLYLQGGIQYGWDNAFDPATNAAASDRFLSSGWFAELYLRYNAYLGASARYDFFDPSRNTKDDVLQAFTIAVNGALLNGLQGIVEYQYLDAGAGPGISTTSHGLAFHALYVF